MLGLLVLAGVAVAQTAATALLVNDQPVSERKIAQTQQNSPLYALKLSGVPGLDLENLLMDQVVLLEAANQDAASIELDSEAFANAIEEFRAVRQLTSDEAYLTFLEGIGFTEEEFLEGVAQQQRLNKRVEEVSAGVSGTEAELRQYYELFPEFITELSKPLFPFDDLKPSVRRRLETVVGILKRDAAIDSWVSGLVQNAQVQFPEGSKRDWPNPVVASVNGFEIRLHQLNGEVYNNPDIVVSLLGMDAKVVERVRLAKVKAVADLIDRAIALQYASHANKPYVGTGAAVIEQINRQQTRNVRVSDAEARAYYQSQKAMFMRPATAVLTGARFQSTRDASAFRAQLLRAKGTNFGKLAARYRGTATEYGPITPDNLTGPHTALLDPKKLTQFGKLYVSGVIREGNTIEVFLVQDLKPATVMPFESVRAEVTQRALEQARSKVANAWWAAERKRHVIVNNLAAVQQALEAQAKTKR